MRYLALILIAFGTISCATGPEYYKSQSSKQLCIEYGMAFGGENYQPGRAVELARRGEDCSEYAALVDAEKENYKDVRSTIDSRDRIDMDI